MEKKREAKERTANEGIERGEKERAKYVKWRDEARREMVAYEKMSKQVAITFEEPYGKM